MRKKKIFPSHPPNPKPFLPTARDKIAILAPRAGTNFFELGDKQQFSHLGKGIIFTVGVRFASQGR
jgi:hypothetical protein